MDQNCVKETLVWKPVVWNPGTKLWPGFNTTKKQTDILCRMPHQTKSGVKGAGSNPPVVPEGDDGAVSICRISAGWLHSALWGHTQHRS